MTYRGNPGPERRRYARIRSFSLVAFDDTDFGACMGRTLDISPGGMRVETFDPVPPGAKREIEVAVGDRIFVTQGTAVHSEKPRKGAYSAGIRFDRLRPDIVGALPAR